MSSVPAGDEDVAAAICYVCRFSGPDAGGEPLRRGCACCGSDAGFVHVSCLAGYAAYVSGRAVSLAGFAAGWKKCTVCTQRFQGLFANDIATAFVVYVTDQYDQIRGARNRMTRVVLSLGVKLSALDGLFRGSAGTERNGIMMEVTTVVSRILFTNNRMREMGFRVKRYLYRIEAEAYDILGRVALCGDSRGYARTACRLFDNQLRVSEALGDARGVALARDNILEAMSHGDYGSCTNSGWVRISRRIYELLKIRLGVENERTIRAGIYHARRLRLDNRSWGAQQLLEELRVTSREHLGRVHPATVEINRMLVVRRGRERY